MFRILFSFIMQFIILNPMTLLGLGIGFYLMLSFNLQGVENICSNPIYYAYIFGFCLVYVCLFRHIYKVDSKKIDWWKTVKGSVWAFINVVAVAALTCVGIHIYNTFSWDAIDIYLRNNK